VEDRTVSTKLNVTKDTQYIASTTGTFEYR
jgi:hypothetical protein